MAGIDDRALDSMSVAPAEQDASAERDSSANQDVNVSGDAGGDESINARLKANPESKEARLDNALDESMDASDPPSSTQPVHNQGPAESSGYDAEAEKQRQS